MAHFTIKLPDVGEGVAEAELVEWHVKVGDIVREDDLLAAVMTDKATVEIPSSRGGKVIAVNGEVGEKIAVGSELVRLEIEGGTTEEKPVEKSRKIRLLRLWKRSNRKQQQLLKHPFCCRRRFLRSPLRRSVKVQVDHSPALVQYAVRAKSRWQHHPSDCAPAMQASICVVFAARVRRDVSRMKISTSFPAGN